MDYRVTDEALTQSANSIRTKSGSSAPIPWDNLTGFKSAIDSITTGSNITEIVLGSYHTDSASGTVVAFGDGADSIPVKDLTISIEPVQSGSGVPSPNNVRPISGRTGASITRCGKNLLKLRDTLAPVTIQGVAWQLNDDGSISASRVSTSSSNSDWSIAVLTLPAGQYVYSGLQSGAGSGSTYQSDIRIDGTSHWGTNPYSFTLTEPTQIEVVLRYYPGYSDDAVFYPMVRLNSQLGEFEAYQGTVYSITFPTEAGTVYGGTLDVTNGLLTVDRIMITIDGSDDSRLASFNTSAANVNRVQSNIYNDIGVENIAFDACDRFEPIAPTTTPSLYKVWNSTTAPRMFFGLPKTVTTLDEAKAWFAENPTHIVAKIASQQTYQLDPTEVLTLLGTNTIFADCGDVSVTYRADPTLAAFVQDVQIDGNSILNNGVANVPIASSSSPGVVKVGPGLQVGSSNELKTNPASLGNTKAGTDAVKPLVPSVQHAAAFYGLAKAAGDTSQSQSANSVGTYTDDAKAAIQRMLGLYNRGELIADVTTTENVTEIVVNTDLSGQAFRLTKLIAIFSASQSTTGTRDSFYGQFVGFDENNTQQTMSFPALQYPSATSAMFAKVILRVEPGMPITCEAIIATSEGNTQNVQGMAKAFVIEYITSFKIYQSGSSKSLIPSGSNLKVYGVRA